MILFLAVIAALGILGFGILVGTMIRIGGASQPERPIRVVKLRGEIVDMVL